MFEIIRSTPFDIDGTFGCKICEGIQTLTPDEINEAAKILCDRYHTDSYAANLAKVNHIQPSLVLRTLFGPLTRNGLLLDITHPDRKDGYALNLSITQTSWSQSFLFMDCLKKHFENANNNYGLLILYEMLGHRYGDLAVVSQGDDSNKYVGLMEEAYTNSYNYADKIKCMKQLFSPWYWGALYFTKLGIKDKAIFWHKKHQEMANKYMNDGRNSYTDKIILSLKMLRDLISKPEWQEYIKQLKKQVHNPHYAKALGRGKF